MAFPIFCLPAANYRVLCTAPHNKESHTQGYGHKPTLRWDISHFAACPFDGD